MLPYHFLIHGKVRLFERSIDLSSRATSTFTFVYFLSCSIPGFSYSQDQTLDSVGKNHNKYFGSSRNKYALDSSLSACYMWLKVD